MTVRSAHSERVVTEMANEEPTRRADLSYVLQDFDWEKRTAPELAIYFCHASGLTSVRLTVARGQSHEDSVAISEGDSTDTVKNLLEGYIDIFKTALDALENAPQ